MSWLKRRKLLQLAALITATSGGVIIKQPISALFTRDDRSDQTSSHAQFITEPFDISLLIEINRDNTH